VVAVLGYVLLPIAALLGLISVEILISFVIVAFLFGILLSVAALALEEFSFRRHGRHREAGRLLRTRWSTISATASSPRSSSCAA
jgi:hypothetical protein